jgi:hypothetical protein
MEVLILLFLILIIVKKGWKVVLRDEQAVRTRRTLPPYVRRSTSHAARLGRKEAKGKTDYSGDDWGW